MKYILVVCFLAITFAAIDSIQATNFNNLKLCPVLGVYNVAHPKSCNKYFICFNGQLLEQTCARGLNFDSESNSCARAHLTKCQLELCPASNVIRMVADPYDCSSFYACANGYATSMQCPAGLMFNRAISSCDLESNVNCLREEDQINAVTPKIICPATGFAKVPHPDDCKQYSICMSGIRADYRCADGLNYDTRTQRCNHPNLSRCFN